jgi:hypothetical protein
MLPSQRHDFLERLARRLGADPTERFEYRGSVWRTVTGHQHPATADDRSLSGSFGATTGGRAAGELWTNSMQFQHA